MNRYQQEVAELDRQHWRRTMTMRILSVLGAAIVALLALWSAGLPPSAWLVAMQGWWSSRDASPVEVRPTVESAPRVDKATSTAAPQSDHILLQGTDSSLSATPLPLYLVATTLGRNKNEAIALIGTSVNNPQTYGTGSILANGARLSEIHKDHVVLTREGRSAELYLDQRDPGADRRRSASELLTVSARPLAPLPVEKVNDGLTDYLRPTPYYDGEGLRGYQVYPGARSAVFTRLGLQPGDVITSINDTPLNEPSQSIELFMQLMHGVAVVATIKRRNTSHRITLDGALISADRQSLEEAAVNTTPALPGS